MRWRSTGHKDITRSMAICVLIWLSRLPKCLPRAPRGDMTCQLRAAASVGKVVFSRSACEALYLWNTTSSGAGCEPVAGCTRKRST
jgi:hypothetical protein